MQRGVSRRSRAEQAGRQANVRMASRERDIAPKFRISMAVRKLASRKADGTLTRWQERGGIGNLWNDGTWGISRVLATHRRRR